MQTSCHQLTLETLASARWASFSAGFRSGTAAVLFAELPTSDDLVFAVLLSPLDKVFWAAPLSRTVNRFFREAVDFSATFQAQKRRVAGEVRKLLRHTPAGDLLALWDLQDRFGVAPKVKAAVGTEVQIRRAIAGVILRADLQAFRSQVDAEVNCFGDYAMLGLDDRFSALGQPEPRSIQAHFFGQVGSIGWDVSTESYRLYAVSCGTRGRHLTAAAALNG